MKVQRIRHDNPVQRRYLQFPGEIGSYEVRFGAGILISQAVGLLFKGIGVAVY